MSSADEPTPAPRRPPPAALVAAILVALTLVLIRERAGEVGLWAWDSYGRLQYIHDYQPGTWADGHLAYHGLMRLLMALGLADRGAVVVETAVGAAGFLTLLWWICRRTALSSRATWLVMIAATVGSPGLVELYLTADDNVLDLPLLLGVFAMMAEAPRDRRDALRRGGLLGGLLAVAALTDVGLALLLLAPAIAAVVALALRERLRAVGLAVATGVAVALYYATHLLTGAKVALHELGAHLLAPEPPLLSLTRFAEYRNGARAISLTPSLHLMRPPGWLRDALIGPLPILLLALAAVLVGWLIRTRGAELRAACRAHFALVAVFAVAALAAYVYEPALIEGWDVLWVGALFGLVLLLRSRPPRRVVGLIIAMVALQGVGTVVAVTHHYGAAWADPTLERLRELGREVVAHNQAPVVLPTTTDRLIVIDLARRVGDRVILLIDDGGPEPRYIRFDRFFEHPISLDDARGLVRDKLPYVDPAISSRARRAIGLP